MCGIAGIMSAEEKKLGRILSGMCDAIAHRGPDDFGYIALQGSSPANPSSVKKDVADDTGKVFLGHRRLSIIDLSGSRQPLCNEDGSVWVVFNGEIYNYVELRTSLAKKGHKLREKGDTEVLVHLWEEYGTEMLSHLVGMFAFAIYDTAKGTLFLARDRFGQKPLYYFERNKNFYFASELQAFYKLEDFNASDINPVAMAQFFRYGFIPNPGTAYKNVFSVPPGHFLLRKNGESSVLQFWKPYITGTEKRVDYEKLESLLDESVRLRLRSDVPFGAFLSGGIDSALVTSSMVKLSDMPVKTFTISTGRESFMDESEEAREVADFLKTEHRQINVTPDFVAVSEKLAAHYGQPYADHSSVLAYYVSKETRNFVKVALTGDGGDELFAGYTGYLKSSFYNSFGRLPFPMRVMAGDLAAALFSNNEKRDLSDSLSSAFPLPAKGENIAILYHKKWRNSVFNPDFSATINDSHNAEIERFTSYYNAAESKNPVEKWMEADQRLYLCDDILVKLDIASMAVSLECRSPLLDHRFAEFANSISVKTKLEGGISKGILRKLAAKRLPTKTASYPKKGFSMPLSQWMRTDLKDWMHSTVFDNQQVWAQYLSPKSVEKLWNEHQSGKSDHQMRLWVIASLGLWKKNL